MVMEFSSLLLPSILLFSFLFYALLFWNQKASSPNPTVLKGYPIIGNLPHFIKHGGRMLEWVTELLAATPTGTVTVPPIVFTSNPSNVEYTTKSHFDNYPKVDKFSASLRDLLGHGIFNIDGDQWKLQRKTASYEFNTKSLRAFVLEKVGHEIQERLVPLLTSASRTGEVLDLQDVLERFAFDNICSLVFAEDPDCLSGRGEEGERFFHAFDVASHLSVERAMLPIPLIWKLKKLLNIGSERRLRDSMATVDEFVERCIRSRRINKGDNRSGDFLSRFAEDGSQSDEFLRDILISFVLAGRDTTPSALTWFFWVLASRSDIADKIREEIRRSRSRYKAETFTLDELREMNYLHAAISESLRLYPPVPHLPRECRADDVLPDGTAVRRGWMVMYSAYAMGRTEGIWGEDCREFKPERWLENGVFRPKDPFRYPVFHAGPRLCLGKDMAYIQMKAVVASILEEFEVEVVEKRGKYQQSITMRMEGGLPVRFKERSQGSLFR